MADASGLEAADRLSAILLATAKRLDELGARDEALGVRKAGRGIGPFKSAESMTPVGRAWRLGVLLIDRDGNLAETGKITRAVTPARPQNLSGSVEVRRADRLAASRGDFAEGDVVNYEYTTVAQDPASLASGTGLISVDRGSGELLVRWGTTDAERRPLQPYIDDRIAMLFDD